MNLTFSQKKTVLEEIVSSEKNFSGGDKQVLQISLDISISGAFSKEIREFIKDFLVNNGVSENKLEVVCKPSKTHYKTDTYIKLNGFGQVMAFNDIKFEEAIEDLRKNIDVVGNSMTGKHSPFPSSPSSSVSSPSSSERDSPANFRS